MSILWMIKILDNPLHVRIGLSNITKCIIPPYGCYPSLRPTNVTSNRNYRNSNDAIDLPLISCLVDLRTLFPMFCWMSSTRALILDIPSATRGRDASGRILRVVTIRISVMELGWGEVISSENENQSTSETQTRFLIYKNIEEEQNQKF